MEISDNIQLPENPPNNKRLNPGVLMKNVHRTETTFHGWEMLFAEDSLRFNQFEKVNNKKQIDVWSRISLST